MQFENAAVNSILLLLSLGNAVADVNLVTAQTTSNSNQMNAKSFTTLPLLSHHTMLQRRNLKVSSDPGVTINNIPIMRKLDGDEDFNTLEVNGLYQGYGTHYVDLWVGTPPQRQTVIVDTGSGITAFPCEGCNDCGHDYHASDFFIESNSQSFHKDDCSAPSCSCRNQGSDNEYCHLSVSYQEGSMWSAYRGRDVTYLGGYHDGPVKKKEEGTKIGGMIHAEDPNFAADFEFEMEFGCQTKITGLFKTQLADGIMGMCLKNSAIFSQMHKQQIIKNPSFSMCFARGDDAAKDGTVAGALTMGGTDEKLHIGKMIYAKGSKAKAVMHGVKIRKFHLMEAGQYGADEADSDNTHTVQIASDALNTGSVIVDSGTTDTYMTRSLAAPFKEAFHQLTGFDYNTNGMKLTDDQVHTLPTILIQLQGYDGNNEPGTPGLAGKIDPDHPNDILIAIPPAHYIEFDSDEKKYVGRFSMTEGRGSVLGANTMRGHDVFFDIPQNGRIGWAVSDCDYDQLIGSGILEENDASEKPNHADDPEQDTAETENNESGNSDSTTETKTSENNDASGGSGGEEEDGDDYYEDETILERKEKPSNQSDENATAGVSSKTAILGIILAMISVFGVYKFISNRRKSSYQPSIDENDQLNDLVLEQDIELNEIS